MASDFIKEKIKDKPLDRRKIAKRIGFTVLIALIFGTVSAVTFAFVYARIKPKNAEDLKEVEFPDHEAAVSEDAGLSSDVVTQDEEPEKGPEDEGSSAPEADSLSGNRAELSENTAPGTVINNITNKLDITPQSFSALYKALHDVAQEAGKAMVTVTATTTSTDWFENTYEDGNSTSGLIVADNGKQLLILTDSTVTKDAEDISVRFGDGVRAKASVIKTDPDTSLQIIGVELSELEDETKDSYVYASLGSTAYASTVGTPVIAIGSPVGIQGSEAYGLITSMNKEHEMSDFNVHLLTTDIYGSNNASGVIVDYNGRVMGVITDAGKEGDTKELIDAYSISDIKDLIENLANARDSIYMGIIGTGVTAEAAEEYSIPKGAYVINVETGSPAMKAGIQSGDVITRIGTQVITDYSDYTAALKELSPGVSTVVTVQRFSRGDYSELTFEPEPVIKE